MRNARELLITYLDAVQEPARAAALFAADGALELPYLASIGLPSRVEGPKEVEALVESLLRAVPDLAFQDPQIFIDTPDQVFAEYGVETVTADGRPFSQLYAGRLVARDGKIALLRESLDVVRAAQAMLPGGVADIPRWPEPGSSGSAPKGAGSDDSEK
jgi:ketosteroid isomerase-like protein